MCPGTTGAAPIPVSHHPASLWGDGGGNGGCNVYQPAEPTPADHHWITPGSTYPPPPITTEATQYPAATEFFPELFQPEEIFELDQPIRTAEPDHVRN